MEGICIPLGVRHDLVKNVTTRGRGRGNTGPLPLVMII